MTSLIYCIDAAVVFIVIAGFVKAARHRARKDRQDQDRLNFVVRAPLSYFVAGIASMSFFGLLSVMSVVNLDESDGSRLYAVCFAVFFALGAYCFYRWCRWRVIVREEELTLRPMIGAYRTFSVHDVKRIEIGTYTIRVYAEYKKLFSFESRDKGSFLLVSYFIEMGVRAPETIDWQ